MSPSDPTPDRHREAFPVTDPDLDAPDGTVMTFERVRGTWEPRDVQPSPAGPEEPREGLYRCLNCGRNEHGCECEGGGTFVTTPGPDEEHDQDHPFPDSCAHPVHDDIKADILQAASGGPDFTPASWPPDWPHVAGCQRTHGRDVGCYGQSIVPETGAEERLRAALERVIDLHHDSLHSRAVGWRVCDWNICTVARAALSGGSVDE